MSIWSHYEEALTLFHKLFTALSGALWSYRGGHWGRITYHWRETCSPWWIKWTYHIQHTFRDNSAPLIMHRLMIFFAFRTRQAEIWFKTCGVALMSITLAVAAALYFSNNDDGSQCFLQTCILNSLSICYFAEYTCGVNWNISCLIYSYLCLFPAAAITQFPRRDN